MPDLPVAPVGLPDRGARIDIRAEVRRIHAGVLLFYIVDAALLGLLGAMGTVSQQLGLCYVVVGCAATECAFYWFQRRGGLAKDLEALGLCLTASTGVVMLVTLAQAPQVGGLMLMSMMALLALSAVQLTWRKQLTLALVLATGSVAVLSTTLGGAGIPSANAMERIVSAVWLTWLMAKVSAHNITGTRLRQQVNKANAELAQALLALEKVASTDELTQLPNRRAILASVRRAMVADTRHGGRLGIALLDIDRFKLINDSLGHEVGDEVLREFGRVLTLGLRPTDQVGRYGGEEFLLVLPDVDDAAAAALVVERLRAIISAHGWSRISPGLAVTASAGVTLLLPSEDGAVAIRRADGALYAAKEQGRNRVITAAEPVVSGVGSDCSMLDSAQAGPLYNRSMV